MFNRKPTSQPDVWDFIKRTAGEQKKDSAPKGLLEIVVTARGSEYHACPSNSNLAIWGRGNTFAEAVGNLVVSHPGIFGVAIKP